ncbi:VOC family protein [Priestia taiwanensis]|uniref:VOC domain-containing protein n=1 Tax=Priestia taiwanensis TaxID=1347902 RepID=A0A917AVW6_9BACI|nr:VOC family protein [Priestia taiwanensis]MBM7363364.1 lactoylglutathione lyase [Priestia taiwanensis]GGE77773.1 hypothetical protein GCM10007140_29280 [Priestia taiwanensis]
MEPRFRIKLYVEDIEKSLSFYEHIIGLKLYRRSEQFGRFNHDCFSLLIGLRSSLDETHYFNRHGKGNGLEIIIAVSSLEEVYKRCVANKYSIETEIEDYSWGMSGFNIIDPDGYFLRITSETIV